MRAKNALGDEIVGDYRLDNQRRIIHSLSSLLAVSFGLSDNVLDEFATAMSKHNMPSQLRLSSLPPIGLQWENALNVFRTTGINYYE